MSHLASKMPHLAWSEGDMGHGATSDAGGISAHSAIKVSLHLIHQGRIFILNTNPNEVTSHPPLWRHPKDESIQLNCLTVHFKYYICAIANVSRKSMAPNAYLPLLFNYSEAPSFVINSKAGTTCYAACSLRPPSLPSLACLSSRQPPRAGEHARSTPATGRIFQQFFYWGAPTKILKNPLQCIHSTGTVSVAKLAWIT